MNYELRTNKGFTLIELVVAVALLAMVISFSGVIFKVSIESYRGARANAEIMQKLRAITDQLNSDFTGLQKDGYLLLHSERKPKDGRKEFRDSVGLSDFRSDRIYYFCTGDFQSWFPPYPRSNIARVYFGHDSSSLSDGLQSECKLARDVRLLTPELTPVPDDCCDISYAQYKVNLAFLPGAFEDADDLLTVGVLTNPPDNHRSLLSENIGSVEIEWTDGSHDPLTGEVRWWGLDKAIGNVDGGYANEINEDNGSPVFYKVAWTPANRTYWPKALRFTFTLYDSKSVTGQSGNFTHYDLNGKGKKGRRFTHIVYLEN
jgi:prepilin-type N-terminal cleavage/methylation domain-containing protein